MNKVILALCWIAGWIHVIWFAPDGGMSTPEFITAVMRPGGGGVDPLVFMAFNLLGIWPLVMVAMLVQDDQGRLKAWPFAFSSMVLGNSALYVYLFLRREQGAFKGPLTMLVRFAESKALALLLLLSTAALLVYGFSMGSTAAFVETWRTVWFVNVMMVDFCLFTLAFAVILPDDLRRRGMTAGPLYACYVLVPVLGATIYLLVRKPLPVPGRPETRV